jgi:hypothetical protein
VEYEPAWGQEYIGIPLLQPASRAAAYAPGGRLDAWDRAEIHLEELRDATPEEVAGLIHRIQRAVDEWSAARAGVSVYEHTGREYDAMGKAGWLEDPPGGKG